MVVGLKTSSGFRWILFRIVYRPLPWTLTLYCLNGHTSTTMPLRSHRLLSAFWISTSVPTVSTSRVCLLEVSWWDVSADLDIDFSRCLSICCHFALTLYAEGGCGTASRMLLPSNSWAGEVAVPLMGVLRYCMRAFETASVFNDPLGPVLPVRILFAVLTATSARPLD